MAKLFTAKAARENYNKHQNDAVFNYIITKLSETIQKESKNDTTVVIQFTSPQFREMICNKGLRNRVLDALESVGYISSMETSAYNGELDGFLIIKW